MAVIGRYSHSSSFLIGTLFTLCTFLGIYFITYFILLGHDEAFVRESEAAIHADIRALKEAETLNGIPYVENLLRSRLADPDNSFFYALRSPQETLLMANIPSWPSQVKRVREGTFLFEVSHDELPDFAQSRRASRHYDIMSKVHTFSSGHQLLVGRDVDDLEVAQYLAQKLGWLMIVVLLLVAVVSFAVAFYVVSRINRIAAIADGIIDSGNLSLRVPVDSSWDDLSKLSIVLNRLLQELEKQVNEVKSVSDNIAHDLRLPLTRLRADIEAIREPEKRTELLQEVDQILYLFNALLRIADIEAEKQKSAFAQQTLTAILEDVIELYNPLAEDKGIQIHSQLDHCQLLGDRDLLFQAFANLLDNAVKFTPKHGLIHIRLLKHTDTIRVCLCDSGPGIPVINHEKVFTRFFRLEESRTTAGHGLGLALVAAVIKLHDGHIRLDTSQHEPNGSPGLCVNIEFKPKAANAGNKLATSNQL